MKITHRAASICGKDEFHIQRGEGTKGNTYKKVQNIPLGTKREVEGTRTRDYAVPSPTAHLEVINNLLYATAKMFPTEGTTIMQITMHSFIVDEGRDLFIKLAESFIIARWRVACCWILR